ncbi:helix-turn-helix domain-containing protein [Hymenobacter jeollabukensis]|uniref:Helix-turn-helix transcriptional regulator n=1 Tax=Hymenobacter jeollabukensis TaxID=2025313 RepID=A0A5R8WIR8_9BACT|nr:AraC family transcriptional regulator [Hymenobacter jeollabukensis]TLM88768.1 helix-turn-helix transcriptional regulator [Hymenobacter jeollabukensis]
MEHLVRIKGMVCPRCIQTVKTLFMDLGFTVTGVELGSLTYRTDDEYPRDLTLVREQLEEEGFEVLDDKQSRTIARLKQLVDEWIQQEQARKLTLAAYASDALHQNYHSLSTLFSDTQGLTLERYLISRRVELARQLLAATQDTLADIADRLGYSSSHHFSNQFKRETGMTPSQYRQLVREMPQTA